MSKKLSQLKKQQREILILMKTLHDQGKIWIIHMGNDFPSMKRNLRRVGQDANWVKIAEQDRKKALEGLKKELGLSKKQIEKIKDATMWSFMGSIMPDYNGGISDENAMKLQGRLLSVLDKKEQLNELWFSHLLRFWFRPYKAALLEARVETLESVHMVTKEIISGQAKLLENVDLDAEFSSQETIDLSEPGALDGFIKKGNIPLKGRRKEGSYLP